MHAIGENRQRGPQSEHWIECATCGETVRGTALRPLEEMWAHHQGNFDFRPKSVSDAALLASNEEVHLFLVRVGAGRKAEYREIQRELTRRLTPVEGGVA